MSWGEEQLLTLAEDENPATPLSEVRQSIETIGAAAGGTRSILPTQLSFVGQQT